MMIDLIDLHLPPYSILATYFVQLYVKMDRVNRVDLSYPRSYEDLVVEDTRDSQGGLAVHGAYHRYIYYLFAIRRYKCISRTSVDTTGVLVFDLLSVQSYE